MADLRCAEKSKAVGHTRTGGFALNAWHLICAAFSRRIAANIAKLPELLKF